MESIGFGIMGVGLGMGLVILGAGLGIGRIGGQAVEGIARQPQAAADIRGSMILTAALIEGATLAAIGICFLVQSGWLEKIGHAAK